MGWEHGARAEALSFGRQHWAAGGEGRAGGSLPPSESFPHTFFSVCLLPWACPAHSFLGAGWDPWPLSPPPAKAELS